LKKGIHPKYDVCKVTCACGNTFETRSTASSINVEICSNCHPFFTGRQKLVDTAGRVEKYMRKYKLGQRSVDSKKENKPKENKPKEEKNS